MSMDLNVLRNANNGAGASMLDTKTLSGYLCTPKYASDHTDTDRMARFYVPSSLYKRVINSFKAASSDPVFKALSSSNPNSKSTGFFKFLLQNVQEAYAENVQVVQTLSDNYVTFSMGSKPPIFSYAGTLINSQEDDWRSEFFLLYSRYLRASKMAKFGGRSSNRPIQNYSYIKYDNVYVRGIMLSLNMNMNSSNEIAVPFSFQYLVQDIVLFKQHKDAGVDTVIVDQAGDYLTAGRNIVAVNTDYLQQNTGGQNPVFNALALKKTKDAMDKG